MATKTDQKISYESKTVIWETYPEYCKSCGLCIAKCPVKCLSYDTVNNEFLGMPAIKPQIDKCIGCKTCQNICPDCAILVRKQNER